ncbi:hypothetical protein EWH23_09670 [Meiothermus sp. PNK-Is4]|nr:hypothetical protein DNA98_04770 [Meiothermus sp. Pnk-1]RYM36531.1 hypothetical protein EWH23_09670 [Meiothermus sp. PNK-Is4]
MALGLGLTQSVPRTELVGYAVLPADTFAPGPASGQFNADGSKKASPPYPSQPVQGFSAIQFAPGTRGAYWVMPDNGYGAKYNSPDYLLRIYQITPDPKTPQGGSGTVRVDSFIQLRDPDKKIPFFIVNEFTPERNLTGFDFDIESFVIAQDGTLWIGDEFGPFLLHFDASGKLLEPPYPTPDFAPGKDPAKDLVRSPQHPALLAASPQPGQMSLANLPSSGGYEGLAINPGKTKLYALLEKTVAGDPAGSLRIHEFDLASQRFTRLLGYYRLEAPTNSIGDFTVVNDNEYLVIERDQATGEAAQFKRIYKVDLSRKDAQGFFAKELVADLLNIADPANLTPYTKGGVFRFPFVTIEDVLVLDARTLLVLNDNNYPGTGGRGQNVKDDNEMIWLRLDKPLALGPGVGTPR